MSNIDFNNKLNKALYIRLSVRFLQQFFVLILSVILARLLSPREFGVVAIVNLVVFYANGITDLGFTNALVQKKQIDHDQINSVFTVDIALSALMIVFFWIGSPYIAEFFGTPEVKNALKAMSFYFLIVSLRRVPDAILRRNIDFTFVSFMSLGELIFTYFLSILLAIKGFSYWSIIYSTLFNSSVVSLVIYLKASAKPRLGYSHSKMIPIYNFGAWNFLKSQFDLVVNKIDYFMIGKFLGPSVLGIYEKSFELSEKSYKSFSMPVGTVFFSAFSRKKDNIDELKEIFLKSTHILSIIVFPVLLGLYSVSEYFVLSCLGSEWEAAIYPIKILCISFIFKSMSGLFSNLNISVGHYKVNAILAGFNSLIFVILCFYLAKFGIIYVSFAVLVHSLLLFIFLYLISISYLKLKFLMYVKSILVSMISSLLMLVVLKSVTYIYFDNFYSIINLLSLISIGAFSYLLPLGVFYKLGKVDILLNLRS